MNKILPFVLLLIISAILIQPINIKANSNDDILYEIVKRNPDLVITGCNETYVYWEFNYRIFDPPIEIREPGFNESTYINKIPSTYIAEKQFIYFRLAAKYDLKYSNWYHYSQYLEELRKELYPIKEKLFAEKGDMGIGTLGIMDNYVPIVVVVTMYKITDEKVNTVLEYIRPFVKKYNALVFFIEDYMPASLYEKQDKVLEKFYLNGFKKYLELVKEYYYKDYEYYGTTIEVKSFRYSPGIAEFYIPENATFNEEFAREAVSILREYTGCEVPLVVEFREYTPIEFGTLELPSFQKKLYDAIIISLFLTILITSVVLIIRDKHKKK
jgi:hypothetical protein